MITQIKSMAQHLHQTGNLTSSRKNLFPSKYHHDLQTLVDVCAIEIVERHMKRFAHARSLNTSLAFFLMDAYSLMDRGFICFLIRSYIKKVSNESSLCHMGSRIGEYLPPQKVYDRKVS